MTTIAAQEDIRKRAEAEALWAWKDAGSLVDAIKAYRYVAGTSLRQSRDACKLLLASWPLVERRATGADRPMSVVQKFNHGTKSASV